MNKTDIDKLNLFGITGFRFNPYSKAFEVVVDAVVDTAKNADEMRRLQDQSVMQGENLQQAAEEIRKGLDEIAQGSGLRIQEIYELYNRFTIIGDRIDATHQDLLLMTESVANLAKIDRASEGDAYQAFDRLNEGLIDGILHKDELEEIIVKLPSFQRILEDFLDLEKGQLFSYLQDNQLTSTQVHDALSKSADTIREISSGIEPTIENLNAGWSNVSTELQE